MDGFRAFTDNPNQDLVLASPIPTSCLKEPVMLGIDEAGRGPVLGPMVYGIAFFAVSRSDQMKSMEFADSKVLTEAKREKIFESIQSHRDVGWSVKILSPNTISNTSLRRRKYNLNQLSHDTAIELVRQVLDKGVNVAELYVDTVGPKDKYQLKLKKIFPSIPKIKVENKADSLFHVVSAASICAKVVRDQVIKEWKFPEGPHVIPPSIDYGSGYPGDPATKAFLKKVLDPVFGFPTFVRFCWSTASTIIESECVVCEWEEVKDEEEGFGDEGTDEFEGQKQDVRQKKARSKPITSYFSKRPAEHDNHPVAKRHCGTGQTSLSSPFFSDRELTRVTCLQDL